ncbi:MAG: hypothetical protein EP149_05585 [Phascolarctobacterium sp.]|nr:hypothetical protein [Phascolarctobacterium sp.]MUU07169.1 hypothetical protein [Phascolarctobacterium sp.]MUU16808.1 hypothetical protein [Phascolarctobacterium sp.]
MDNTIDIASVGGMYAGKITLVANDTDAGIKNFGNINASGSGITLASDGKLAQHGRLAAQKGPSALRLAEISITASRSWPVRICSCRRKVICSVQVLLAAKPV